MRGQPHVPAALFPGKEPVPIALQPYIYIVVTHKSIYIYLYIYVYQGTRWRSKLRHCASSRKVTGSIPDCITKIFHWHKTFDSTMAVGLTQRVTEMNTTNISCVVKAAGVWGWRSYPFMCPLSLNLGASTSWKPQGLSRALVGLFYLYIYIQGVPGGMCNNSGGCSLC